MQDFIHNKKIQTKNVISTFGDGSFGTIIGSDIKFEIDESVHIQVY